MNFGAAPSHLVVAAQSTSTAFSALIWWAIPIVGVLGSIIYVVWVSKFQDKFDNQTNRSVGKFQEFQKTFDPKGDTGSVRIIGQDLDSRLNEEPEAPTQP